MTRNPAARGRDQEPEADTWGEFGAAETRQRAAGDPTPESPLPDGYRPPGAWVDETRAWPAETAPDGLSPAAGGDRYPAVAAAGSGELGARDGEDRRQGAVTWDQAHEAATAALLEQEARRRDLARREAAAWDVELGAETCTCYRGHDGDEKPAAGGPSLDGLVVGPAPGSGELEPAARHEELGLCGPGCGCGRWRG